MAYHPSVHPHRKTTDTNPYPGTHSPKSLPTASKDTPVTLAPKDNYQQLPKSTSGNGSIGAGDILANTARLFLVDLGLTAFNLTYTYPMLHMIKNFRIGAPKLTKLPVPGWVAFPLTKLIGSFAVGTGLGIMIEKGQEKAFGESYTSAGLNRFYSSVWGPSEAVPKQFIDSFDKYFSWLP